MASRGSMARNGAHLAWWDAHGPRRPEGSVENAQLGPQHPNCEGAGEQPDTAHGPHGAAKLTLKPPCVPTAPWLACRRSEWAVDMAGPWCCSSCVTSRSCRVSRREAQGQI